MSWEFAKTLCELIQMLSIYVVMAGCGVTGIVLTVAVACWVVDYVRKELGR